MDKSPDAFRTISEVAEQLDIPAHVLRFWETRFPQIRPVKRAGGRRYYRPNDIALLTGIKRLLHDEGLTIRGVQKILREQGVRHVSGLASGSVPQDEDSIEAQLSAALGLEETETVEHTEAETAQIIALETVLAQKEAAKAAERAAAEPPSQGSLFGDMFSGADRDGDVQGADQPLIPEPVTEAPFIALDEDEPASSALVALQAAVAIDQTPPAPAAPISEAEVPDSSDTDAAETRPARIAPRLRALPRQTLTSQGDGLHALHKRLVALRGRLATGARKRPR